MFSKFLLFFRRQDLYLVGASVLLCMVGGLMIYSTTYANSDNSSLLFRQAIFFVVGLTLLFLFSSFDYRAFRRLSPILYLIAVVLMVAVLVVGSNIKGSSRWFNLGIFQLQPVEFAKLSLILFLSAFFQKRLSQMHQFKNIIISGFYTGILVALTLLQPDLGSAIVLIGIWFGLLLVARVKKRHLFIVVVVFLITAALAWMFFLKDYQKSRVLTFIDPQADPQGQGYNALQSIIAVGSGGIFGRGLARGVASQLRFLPERQTDFIFASLAEELGLVGAVFLLILLGVWFLRIIRIIRLSQENFGQLAAAGVFFYLFVQTSINIGMNIGVLPITGIPLPLVSYGGSSMVSAFVALGILESIASRSQTVRFD